MMRRASEEPEAHPNWAHRLQAWNFQVESTEKATQKINKEIRRKQIAGALLKSSVLNWQEQSSRLNVLVEIWV